MKSIGVAPRASRFALRLRSRGGTQVPSPTILLKEARGSPPRQHPWALVFTRAIALALSLVLGLSHPAFALRVQAGLESDTGPELERKLNPTHATAAGLEEALEITGLTKPTDAAYDSRTQRLFVTEFEEILRAFDATTGKPTGLVIADPPLKSPQAVAYDPGDNVVFVAERDASRIQGFDASTGHSAGLVIQTSSQPVDIALDPDSEVLFSLESNRVAAFHARTGLPLKLSIPIPDGFPLALAYDPTTRRIFVLVRELESINRYVSRLRAYDATTGKPTGLVIERLNTPTGLAIDPATQTLLVEDGGRLETFNAQTGEYTGLKISGLSEGFHFDYYPEAHILFVPEWGTGQEGTGRLRAFSAVDGKPTFVPPASPIAADTEDTEERTGYKAWELHVKGKEAMQQMKEKFGFLHDPNVEKSLSDLFDLLSEKRRKGGFHDPRWAQEVASFDLGTFLPPIIQASSNPQEFVENVGAFRGLLAKLDDLGPHIPLWWDLDEFLALVARASRSPGDFRRNLSAVKGFMLREPWEMPVSPSRFYLLLRSFPDPVDTPEKLIAALEVLRQIFSQQSESLVFAFFSKKQITRLIGQAFTFQQKGIPYTIEVGPNKSDVLKGVSPWLDAHPDPDMELLNASVTLQPHSGAPPIVLLSGPSAPSAASLEKGVSPEQVLGAPGSFLMNLLGPSVRNIEVVGREPGARLSTRRGGEEVDLLDIEGGQRLYLLEEKPTLEQIKRLLNSRAREHQIYAMVFDGLPYLAVQIGTEDHVTSISAWIYHKTQGRINGMAVIHSHNLGAAFPSSRDFAAYSLLESAGHSVREFVYGPSTGRVLEYGVVKYGLTEEPSDMEMMERGGTAIRGRIWREGKELPEVKWWSSFPRLVYVTDVPKSYFNGFLRRKGAVRVELDDRLGQWVRWDRNVTLGSLLKDFIIAAGLEEVKTTGHGRMDVLTLAQQAKSTSVRVVIGSSVFKQVPGLRQVVEAFGRAGLEERFILLPEENLPEEELTQRLIHLAAEAFAVPNLSLVAYAGLEDLAMQQFEGMAQLAGVPFQWRQPTVLRPLVRQILLDLGVPQATATEEAVGRFLWFAGLEEAA